MEWSSTAAAAQSDDPMGDGTERRPEWWRRRQRHRLRHGVSGDVQLWLGGTRMVRWRAWERQQRLAVAAAVRWTYNKVCSE